MEKHIKARFNDQIYAAIQARYNLSPDQIKLLDGFESFIFEIQGGGEPTILRLSHSGRRSQTWIQAEVDWINYLVEGGASAAQALVSPQGNLVESFDDGHGEFFFGTTFVKAQGKHAWGIEWTPELIWKYGQMVGCIHKLSKDYELRDPAVSRFDWEHPVIQDVQANLPPSEAEVAAIYDREYQAALQLPRSRETWGLIHYDAHSGNFFIEEDGTFTLFDFDDCCYGYYAYDIAMVLFYHFLMKDASQEEIRGFLNQFMAGYRSETDMVEYWLGTLPHFMKLREVELYGVIHRSFDVENLDDDPWVKAFMTGRKARILGHVPVIDYNF